MDKHKDHQNERFGSSELSNIQDSTGNSRLSSFVSRTYTLSTFHLIAGLSQMLVGIAVITVSILGLINPLWVSLSLTMVASVSTMIGLYLVYITVSEAYDSNSLLRNAMQRVMKSKN